MTEEYQPLSALLDAVQDLSVFTGTHAKYLTDDRVKYRIESERAALGLPPRTTWKARGL